MSSSAPAPAAAPVPAASSPQFEIGLVLAGAVSAGAYTAGVLDFLLEALDAWEQAKLKPDPEHRIPRHRVFLRAAAGSSAGGMCAAQLAALSNYGCPPMRSPETAIVSDNVMFESWVNRIDISSLLATGDEHAESLLDCTVIDQIAAQAFTPNTPAQERPYLRPGDFTVFTTVTNLRGIPYLIHHESAAHTFQGHDLSRHAHHWKFVLIDPDHPPTTLPPDTLALPANSRTTTPWLALRDAAVASGAFPVGLKPRILSQPLPAVEATHGAPAPTWPPVESVPPNTPEGAYRYWAVDGGTVNNEPLELVRAFLSGHAELKNPRESEHVRGITLLVDPFVGWNDGAFDDDTHDPEKGLPRALGLLRGIVQTFGAVKNQARFKPDELLAATNEKIFSRFLISPIRGQRNEPEILSPFAIASGSLGGFGGFLARRFRVHDYVLGRRNAQQFLRRHFALKITPDAVNPNFEASFTELLRRGAFYDEDKRQWFMPLIPLIGSVTDEIPEPRWPDPLDEKELESLRTGLERRADHLVSVLSQDGLGRFQRFGLKLAWRWFVRRKLIDAAIGRITSALRKHRL